MERLKDTSMPAVFQQQVRKYGDRACVSYKTGGRYVDISWNRMNTMVRNLAAFLISRGIQPGDRVAIFSPNRYEWWVSDLAILSIGAVDVPIYATNSAEEAYYVLQHSESKGCLAGAAEHLQKVMQIRDRLPGLEFILAYDTAEGFGPDVLTFDQALQEGEKKGLNDVFESRLAAVKPSDMATIIYTSGTTGPPKGVMLSHDNFVSNVRQALADFWDLVSDQDVLLSFLPLSHSLERTAGYYMPIAWGAQVAFAEDFSRIQENMVEIKPTCIISVPRFYEKIHSGILAKVGEAPATKQALFKWAIETARLNLPYACTQKPPKGFFALRYRLADKIIFSKLKTVLGMDRLRFAVSGGGALSVSDAEFFLGMGITVLEGFGLTETTPITNVNRFCLIKPGTVGPPVPETTVKISPEGEILIKGPQVMLGYYKDEAATREAFTEDGFFRTGDLGAVDADGYLSITGRIKDIIVTAGGKNIAPRNIESRLMESPYIEQVAVIGEKRKYLSALIVPAFEELKKWARTHQVPFTDHEDLIQNQTVVDLYTREIEGLMADFARVEQIRKFRLLPHEWTQETGEMTPTLKLKRKILEEKFKGEIEKLYPPEPLSPPRN